MPPPAGGSRAVAATSASDRRQSTRQGRTGVTRPNNYYARSFAGRLAALGGMEQTPPAANNTPGFLPAVTHFTDCIAAFPKEMIKHFSMLKEVEAKIHDPDILLKMLLDEINRQPIPTRSQQRVPPQSQVATVGDNSTNGSVNGSIIQDALAGQQVSADSQNMSAEEQADLKKRQLFLRLRVVIAGMLPMLDEKLVVLNSAKSSKDKLLARMNTSYAHLDDEISEEARYGSINHWAYADKEEKKKGGTAHERQRREVVSANNLAAAAQAVQDNDTAAARSDARREAVANKRYRHQQVDSDFDDPKPVKKTHKRKQAAEAAAVEARGIGLGITGNGAPQQGKRKKTEKALAAAAQAAPAMERSLSGALQAAQSGGRAGTSPRATPSLENGGGRRKPKAPPASHQGRKRGPIAAQSPPLVSSPLAPAFATAREVIAAAQRPQSSRARKNSTANSVVSNAQETVVPPRSSSAQSTRPANSNNAITELEQAPGVVRDNQPSKGALTPKESGDNIAPLESSALKHEVEDTEAKVAEAMDVDPPVPAPVTTRAGRTSKTATPIVGTFPEVPMVRSRSTRNVNNGNGSNSHASSENNSTTTTSKRGHKKNASTHNAAAPSPALKAKSTVPSDEEPSSPGPELSDGVDEDGDEPRYCYCNEVSYGNMIACDNEKCPREWFHLACVNMDKAPNARTKWFCSDECKEQHAKDKTGRGGRPGSSRQ